MDPEQPWKPIYLLQPLYNIALALGFEYGIATDQPCPAHAASIVSGMSATPVRRLRNVATRLTTPLLPDYLSKINPLWSARELRCRVVTVTPETADAATLVIKQDNGTRQRTLLDQRDLRHEAHATPRRPI